MNFPSFVAFSIRRVLLVHFLSCLLGNLVKVRFDCFVFVCGSICLLFGSLSDLFLMCRLILFFGSSFYYSVFVLLRWCIELFAVCGLGRIDSIYFFGIGFGLYIYCGWSYYLYGGLLVSALSSSVTLGVA